MPRGRRTQPNGRSWPEQYVPLSYSLLRSDAWRSLNGSAMKVFLELRSRYHGSNNGKLCLSFEDAATLLGLGKATVGRAYKELQAKGFIVLTKRGHWWGRQATEWAVTDKSYQGHIPTNAWKTWRAGQKTELGSNTVHITTPDVP